MTSGTAKMATKDDVYRKFGEASEAAQILETELGTLLLEHKLIEADLFEKPDSDRATAIYDQINKQTLGQLIRSLGHVSDLDFDVDQVLSDALVARNRLAHSFYLKHNLRINSEEGRDVMMRDLDVIHICLLQAHKAALLLSGADVEQIPVADWASVTSVGFLPIRT